MGAHFLAQPDHPSTFVASDDLALIEREAPVAQHAQRLTRPLVELFVQRRWLRMFVPHEVGGDEWGWTDALRLLEAVSWADGGVGWALNLGAGGNIFAGYLPLELSRAWFGAPEAWVAGSGMVAGTATLTDEGYRVRGRWPFVTGAPHASLFTVVCRVEGREETIALALQPAQVTVIPGWQGLGLQASATCAIAVEDAHVPSAHLLPLGQIALHIQRPLYRLPFDVFAVPTLAVSVSGCAVRLMDEALADGGVPADARDAVAAAQQVLWQARAQFYRVLEACWQDTVREGALSDAQGRALIAVGRDLNAAAQRCAEAVYRHATMEVVLRSTPLCRRWCDLVTASKHGLLRASS